MGFKESEEECLTEKGREFQFTGPMCWKALSPGPPAHPEDTENPSIRSWVKRGRRVELKQLEEVWRSCTRDNVEVDESYFVLNPAADW